MRQFGDEQRTQLLVRARADEGGDEPAGAGAGDDAGEEAGVEEGFHDAEVVWVVREDCQDCRL